MSKKDLINLVSAILKGLKELDESEYQQLLEGKGRIKFIGLDSLGIDKSKKRRKSNKITLTEDDIVSLLGELQVCKTRDDAYILLHKGNRKLVKESLNRLAQMLGVYVSKADKQEIIEEKIIESVVGTRLRSEAIRGLNLKGN